MSGTLGKLFIKEYAPGTFSSVQLESLIKDFELQKDIKFDIVFVDYLGIMKSDRLSPSAGLYSYIKSIAEELRAVAIKTKLPIISAQQLNRSAVNNKEADNSSISDSLGSVMTADFIMFLLQNEEMKQNSEICMKVTKNRFNGRTDTWIMGVDYEKMRFIDLENDFGEVRVQSTNTDFSLA
jgi:replicative DNA helicase